MATTDKARGRAILREAEQGMDTLFGQLATEIGQIVLAAAGDDGVVPPARLQGVLQQAERAVDRVFLGVGAGKPFSEQNEPLSPFAKLISVGQKAQIEVALERTARILDQFMPADVADAITRRWMQGASAGGQR